MSARAFQQAEKKKMAKKRPTTGSKAAQHATSGSKAAATPKQAGQQADKLDLWYRGISPALIIVVGIITAGITGIGIYLNYSKPTEEREGEQPASKSNRLAGQEHTFNGDGHIRRDAEGRSTVDDNLITRDAALSFAGENREYVDQVAKQITLRGMTVFYDKYEQADLWGKNLYDHLTKVYRDDSKYCLVFISEHYAKKQWTNLERRAAQARAFRENEEYILPVRLDDTQVEGILDTTAFIDGRHTTPEQLAEMLRFKINKYNKEHGIKAEIIRVEDVLRLAGITAKGQTIKDSMCEISCPTCKTKQLLSEAPIKLCGDETTYECKNECQTIAVVGRLGSSRAWPGRGFRVKDYVIRNASDIYSKPAPGAGVVLLPARPAALMKQRPEDR